MLQLCIYKIEKFKTMQDSHKNMRDLISVRCVLIQITRKIYGREKIKNKQI